jgi:hypothetical protein
MPILSITTRQQQQAVKNRAQGTTLLPMLLSQAKKYTLGEAPVGSLMAKILGDSTMELCVKLPGAIGMEAILVKVCSYSLSGL